MRIDYSNKSLDELEKIKLTEEIKKQRAFPLFKPEFIGLISVLATIIFGILQYVEVKKDQNLKQIEKLKNEKEELKKTIHVLELITAKNEVATISTENATAKLDFTNTKNRIENEKRELIETNNSISEQYDNLKKNESKLSQNIESLKNEEVKIIKEKMELDAELKRLSLLTTRLQEKVLIDKLINNLQIRLKTNIIMIFNFQTSTKVKEDKDELRIDVKSEIDPVIKDIKGQLDQFGDENIKSSFNKIVVQIEEWLNDSRSIRRIYPFYNLNRIKRINSSIDKLADEIKNTKPKTQ